MGSRIFFIGNKRISFKIIQCYTPTNDAEDETKESVYQLHVLEVTARKLSTKDITIGIGDYNAKVGTDKLALNK